MKLSITPVPHLPDLLLVDPPCFGDARGFFMEMYHRQRYADQGLTAEFVQDNMSRSQRGTLRGLHYQLIRPQAKLVSVLEGEVYDVAVDVRRGSPTFGKWHGEILSAENRRQLFIPQGFAHGFLVLSETALFYYKCSDYYCPEGERGIRYDDPQIGIPWPIPGALLSDKDQRLPHLDKAPAEDLPAL